MKTHQSLNYFFILSILFACSSKERKPRVIEVPGGEKYADLPLYVTAAGNTIAYADAEKVYFFDNLDFQTPKDSLFIADSMWSVCVEDHLRKIYNNGTTAKHSSLI